MDKKIGYSLLAAGVALRVKFIIAGSLIIALAGGGYFYLPNPWWTTGRLLDGLKRDNELHRLISAELIKNRAADSDMVIPALVLAMGDSWNEVRGAASASLCAIGGASSPYLNQALHNDNFNVRDMAALTLECIKRAGNK
ncbi:MAG: hypothetical protein A2X34_07965 [Elusimicrobia bacterium GWC2_51_8]|nr:MAG: hypothetical protein A2X33_06660 [Elusimicrobia bacterium GWA2_51_34]OGR60229.1 MAG: hypothetical protein A2X34_07965 [Elusimicrobia bacterium GWC2_51_8]OGR88673.1 MAG: hypothetical protein A2021_06480 [Elusimicrobia bacterium GWF2_52_66]HAF96682.1 hypothetical protein [Elusimicrobiota bacterium]HCE96883.1 hypothetical protein [Elusimicrobiota bacterium]